MPGLTGSDRSACPSPHELIYTGTCEVSLSRAVVPYTDLGDPGGGGRIEDLGMGVVVDSDDATRATVLDLGSGKLRRADLTEPVVILGWLYHGTVRALVDRATQVAPDDGSAPIGTGQWRAAALRLLTRTGFSHFTRPLFLRVGFRDLVEDLDLHEELAVRIKLPGGVARAHLEYAESILHIRTASSVRHDGLETALTEAFPGRPIQRSISGAGLGTQVYQVVIPVSRSLVELRCEVRRLRRGFLHLLARFESSRYKAVQEALSGFGERDSLAVLVGPRAPGARLRTPVRAPRPSTRPGSAGPGPSLSGRIH